MPGFFFPDKVVKNGHKKEKIKKSSLLYNIKTSEFKTERNLNKVKSGLKTSFKKEKTKVLSIRRYRLYVSQIEAHFRHMITKINLNSKYFVDLNCFLRKYF